MGIDRLFVVLLAQFALFSLPISMAYTSINNQNIYLLSLSSNVSSDLYESIRAGLSNLLAFSNVSRLSLNDSEINSTRVIKNETMLIQSKDSTASRFISIVAILTFLISLAILAVFSWSIFCSQPRDSQPSSLQSKPLLINQVESKLDSDEEDDETSSYPKCTRYKLVK